MTGFVVPKCADCDHVEGDHLSNGPSLYAGPRGQCMYPGCHCRQFAAAETRDAEWLHQAAKRLDEHEAKAWRQMR